MRLETPSNTPSVADRLAGRRIFLTGATGFVGKVLVETLLRAVPDLGGLLLLVRPGAGRSAAERMRKEILESPALAWLRAHHGDAWEAWAAERIEAVEGDLAQHRLGLEPAAYEALAGRIDAVVAAAATTRFDERLDRALEVNARGALRALRLARAAGNVPFVQVSTAFVSGTRQGVVPEELAVVGGAEKDPAEVLAALDCAIDGQLSGELDGVARRGAESSRTTAVRQSPGPEASESSKAVQPATGGERAGGAPSAGTDSALVAVGSECARRFGFHDAYTLTKALAERLIDRHRGATPVAVVRPAVIESAVRHPMPGWIDAVRVADPLLVAYGRGKLRAIPGDPRATLELVPVDHVANALVAALAALAGRKARPGLTVYHLGAAGRPVELREMMEAAREGFRRAPLSGADGRPVEVPPVRFVSIARLRRRLLRRRTLVEWLAPKLGARGRRLAARRSEIDHFVRLLDVYGPYFDHRARYDDSNARALAERLAPADRETLLFARTIDWRRHLANVHLPGLVRYALRSESGAPKPEPPGRQPDVARPEIRAAQPDSGPPQEPGAVPNISELAEHPSDAATLFGLLSSAAARHPDRIALQICRDGRWLRYTYAEAVATTANISLALRERYGIDRGDRVALWAAGSPEWVLAAFALHRLGAAIVPIDPQWPAEEVARAARFAGAKLVMVVPGRARELVDALLDGAASPADGVPAGVSAAAGGTSSESGRRSDRRSAAEPAGRDRLDGQTPSSETTAPLPVVELAAPLVPEPWVARLPGAEAIGDSAETSDLAAILFTSGTTVAPKAVPLTHANYLANVRDLVPLMESDGERLLSVLPIHHAFEYTVGLLVPLTGGGTVSYVSKIDPVEISWTMGVTSPTMLVAVPRLLDLLHGGIRRSVEAGGPALCGLFAVLGLLSELTGGRWGHKLFGKVHRRFGGALRRIATGGSALEPELGRSFRRMGFAVAEGYGMTETSPVLTVNAWREIRFGTVGRPLPGVEVELRPLAGEPPGTGEIRVRGASVFSGYLGDPEATREVLDEDGWFATGDVGRFDSAGRLTISGRLKEVIVTAAGKNVHPDEVEARYRDLPGAAELTVVGLPGRAGGEEVTLAVVLDEGAGTEAEEALRAAVSERGRGLPSYQRPTRVEIVRGDLPKTTTLKVRRAGVRELLLAGSEGAAPAAHAARPAAPPAASAVVWSEAERRLVGTVARVARCREELLRPAVRLDDLGVDSLTRVELFAELEAGWGVRVPEEETETLRTVGDLVALLPESTAAVDGERVPA